MLATTLEPTSGRVLYRGQDIWSKPIQYRMAMGFMPDFCSLYDSMKVRELLTYFAIAHDLPRQSLPRRVTEVIRLIDLEDKAEDFVKGLSRGMLQRLALGRAILHKPALLLLDEPASGLDPLARRLLFDILRAIHAQQAATIIISSHILGELSELCTSVGIMHGGRFLEAGSTEAIIRKIMPHRRISLLLAGGAETAANMLAGFSGVSNVKQDGERLNFQFDGTNADLARLNADLIRASVGVALMEESRSSLHEVYFAIAERDNNAPSA
jgi:ABC-2 type transport system ATP-binding protein